MMRYVVTMILVLLLCILVGAGYLFWQNNKDVGFPSRISISHSHAKALSWLKKNRELVLAAGNPPLWWMLNESAGLTLNPDLISIVNEYKSRELVKKENEIWRKLFDKNAPAPNILPDIKHFPDYGWLLVYGLTCNKWLARDEAISEQLKLDYCDRQRLRPTCVTHQLMGFVFMERFGCRDERFDKANITILHKRIVSQLVWDARVVDVYIQRVLMLAATGASDQIKPVWISRILDAQAEDGGWSSFEPLIPLGDGMFIGFTGKGVGIIHGKSSFHATAQATYLLSLLLK